MLQVTLASPGPSRGGLGLDVLDMDVTPLASGTTPEETVTPDFPTRT